MASSQEPNNNTAKQDIVDLGIYYLDLLVCPLDFIHKVRRHRMPYHLLKCKKNFPDKILCPHGHFYYCDKHEMAKHVEICPFKPKMVQESQIQGVTQVQQAGPNCLTHNYDVDNYKTDEPYWD